MQVVQATVVPARDSSEVPGKHRYVQNPGTIASCRILDALGFLSQADLLSQKHNVKEAHIHTIQMLALRKFEINRGVGRAEE